jgi:hypothetical protein
MNEKSANFLSLFASSSTLICCALPALFVALGAGAAFASVVSALPFLIVLSQYKVAITLFALVMITLAGYSHYVTYHSPCPIDPELGRLCQQTRRRSRYVYYASVLLFLFASVFTYVVPKFL